MDNNGLQFPIKPEKRTPVMLGIIIATGAFVFLCIVGLQLSDAILRWSAQYLPRTVLDIVCISALVQFSFSAACTGFIVHKLKRFALEGQGGANYHSTNEQKTENQ